MYLLRWILMLPLAISAAWISYLFVTSMVWSFLVAWFLPPESQFVIILSEVLGSVFMGAVYVVVCGLVSPDMKRRGILTITSLAMVVLLILLAVSLLTGDWRGVYGVIAIIVGVIITSRFILTNQEQPDLPHSTY